MKIISEQNIGRVSFIFAVVVVSAVIFAVGVFFVVRDYESALQELDRFERTLIDQEKHRLKADVDAFVLRIEALSEHFSVVPESSGEAEDNPADDAGTAAVPAIPDWDRVLEELQRAADLEAAGYFVYHLHKPDGGDRFATMLFNPARPDLVGQQLSTDFPDARGYNFRKVFVQDLRNRGESFVIYHYQRDEHADGNGNRPLGRKLAYLRLYPESGWIAAKNTTLDWIDELAAAGRTSLKSENKSRLVLLGCIFVGGMALALVLAYLFSLGTRPLFEHYRNQEREVRGQNESLKKLLEQQNRTDTLTSAMNRSHFNQELVKEMARSDRYQTPLSMILFDVDDFKAINDRLGCEAGDTVLVELVNMVQDNIRQTDILARWGGEEFAILAPGINLSHAGMFAEKLRRLIEDAAFTVAMPVTCSFGVAFYEHAENQHAFVQRIDEALVRAKAAGKNRCVAA